ncbi:helix-turn-helix domain-containing protein [Yeosuana sp. AK3]
MPANIITTDDLRAFKLELLADIRKLLNNSAKGTPKKWIKSSDVKKMMGISQGTLQTFRDNGTLPFSKIGGVIYYDHQEISTLFEQNKISK